MRTRERLSQARARGRQAGKAAASWVFDGNTTDRTRDAVATMLDDGDPTIDGAVQEPEWLSGEWAGESINELLGDLLQDDDTDSEVEDAYESSASLAFWREVEKGARR